MPRSTPITRLQQQLTDALAPLKLEIDDDSAKHVGHAGAKKGGHYRVYIVAEAFTGRPLIARHRMVYEAVAKNLNTEVHALSIVAKSPIELAAPPPVKDEDSDGDVGDARE